VSSSSTVPVPDVRFAGRVALVTGAGSGLGRATAHRLAAAGARVAALDVDGEAARATAESVTSAGGEAVPEQLDVSDPGQVRAAVARLAGGMGRPEVLVNCAGVGGFEHTTDVEFETWSRTLGVNLTGTFLMCQAALPHLLDGGGSIVNIASNSGLQGVAYAAAYCASKGGVVQLTRALALEYVGRDVRVNAVAPGGMLTPMLEGFILPEDAQPGRLPRGTAAGYATPEEIAELVAFVASDEARFMVGAVVAIDGGLTA